MKSKRGIYSMTTQGGHLPQWKCVTRARSEGIYSHKMKGGHLPLW